MNSAGSFKNDRIGVFLFKFICVIEKSPYICSKLELFKIRNQNKNIDYGKGTRIEGYERGWKASRCR